MCTGEKVSLVKSVLRRLRKCWLHKDLLSIALGARVIARKETYSSLIAHRV